MDIYAEESAFMTVEDYQRIVARIKKGRFLYQEWLEPIVVEADKKPIRWLSDFVKEKEG